MRRASRPDRCQREVAAALEKAVDHAGHSAFTDDRRQHLRRQRRYWHPLGATGDEDDDWFFTFISRIATLSTVIPVYPSVGNHDTGETEASDARQQLLDNFFLNERFAGEESAGRSSIGPGLFYRFHYGADIEFVCIDTSRQSFLFGDRFFEHENDGSFLDAAFPDVAAEGTGEQPWLIPFTHHPPFCAGPDTRIQGPSSSTSYRYLNGQA